MDRNPLLAPSSLPFGAPRFDLLRAEHYLPAFRAAIAEGKAEADAVAANPEPPDFTYRNTNPTVFRDPSVLK